jgi:hypothetical protein
MTMGRQLGSVEIGEIDIGGGLAAISSSSSGRSSTISARATAR